MKKTDKKRQQTILIVDDSEINRSLLADMLGNEFTILEAEDGTQAVATLQQEGSGIDLVLLDIVMPKMDGFEVLAVMNRNNWIKDIPVIMISSETSPSCIERAYELGVTDFINRPFDVWIVRRRVMNTLMLSSKQKKLVGMVTDQIFEREKMSNLMITILSHIVEFRNGESGMHVLHIRTISELLLKSLALKTDKYGLTQADISLISTASALHDIGKIGIPDHILNKPGKFTPEEYEIMKTHSEIGASMLNDLDFIKDEKLVKYAYEICRHHHERYDGRGYPDGLKGEEIPISAQIVSLADVYDALTSTRVYKPPFSHDKALQMILNGECGLFNPLLLECLDDVKDKLVAELQISSPGRETFDDMRRVADEMLQKDELSTSARTLTLLENERIKTRFFAELSHEIQFEYVSEPPMLMISDFGERKLGLEEITMNPRTDAKVRNVFGEDKLKAFVEIVQKTTPENYAFSIEMPLPLGGEQRWTRVSGRALFSGEPLARTGVIGKIIDINSEKTVINELQHKATHDPLTLLYNNATARELITRRLIENPNREYVMLYLDLDYFKTINDTYGHNFGNDVLRHISDKLRAALRKDDIIARVGGDEFIAFFESHKSQDATIKRIFDSLIEPFRNLPLSVSIGAAQTTDGVRDYESLYNNADRAMYEAKRGGKQGIRHYGASVTEEFPTVTVIDEPSKSDELSVKLSSKKDLTALLKEARKVHDSLRILDATTMTKYVADINGEFDKKAGEEEYCGAGRNSVAERALMTKSRACDLAFRGGELYQSTALYVECAGKPYVLEVVEPLNTQTLSAICGTSEIIAMIDRLGGKRYVDVATNAYNNNFYEEQLKDLTDFYSVAAVKTDAADGDSEKSASKVAETIYSCVRGVDALIRKNGSEFLLIMKNVGEERFEEALNRTTETLEKEGFKVKIGSCRALGKLETIVEKAEKNANKKVKNKEKKL